MRNVSIDPRDAIKCGIMHGNQYFVDTCLVFGAVNGTLIFQSISDAIRHILLQEGVEVWNYIDDVFAAIEGDAADDSFHQVHTLITRLGLPLNPDKLSPPTTL